ncbi:MAG: 2,3,4,5-tetrahydropyridine-2,6-dicarboxylate N-succinyltransferase [Bifidobacteriaceae bacterium]|jgi:2,3,4,5-tetrahydropyridine-2-carboxylate N-succinyltransferase|nr:2,3,4,5-tetrahydropyridine-2,6-dicarboxylate N-succinyltransferase [Bifidobacteriaceae bacterium]
MSLHLAYGAGVAWTTYEGITLDTWYPAPALGQAPEDEPWPAQEALETLCVDDPARRVFRMMAMTKIEVDEPPVDTQDVYLRLHLLSHRLVQVGQVNLEGIFRLLPNVVWTNAGPCAVDDFERTRMQLELTGRGPVRVGAVDKIPPMADYVVPRGVRIADAARVRLGAHLAPGTTVMHEGFINFNAGTLGASMIEGRVSQGVVVEAGADIGGGASTMGTLSGGGTEHVRIGAGTLLGANSGVGISLGADCVVEAGLYLTAGAKVTMPDGAVVKASTLSGQSGWLFRRNSVSGAIEACPRKAATELNSELHAN